MKTTARKRVIQERLRAAVLSGAVALSGGCMVGPDYVKPKAEAPAAYKETGEWKTAEPQDHLPRGKWWEIFNEPQLNALEEQIEISNQNVQQAYAQFRQARAVVQEARAAFFPTVTVNPQITRAKSSNTLGSQPIARGINTLYQFPVEASWQIDLWGQARRAYESTVATAQSSAATLETLRLTAQAELAQDYFQLRALDAQKQLLDDTVIGYQKSLQLTKNRYASGVASRADIAAAETLLRSTEAQAIDVGVLRAQTEHAIAILIGKPPAMFSLAPAPLATLPPPIPLGIPSTLLERRPDVAAAERSVQAANAQIGVAIAAFYPTLTLSGAFGWETSSSFGPGLGNLFIYPSRFWSLGGQMAGTLFNGGLFHAQTDAARAAYDGTVAAYRQTVLTGFQEVEDNLAALQILEREAKVQDDAVAAADQSVQLFTNQYKAGTISYLDLVVVQTALLNNKRTAVTILGNRMNAAVLLVKALGGGWNATDLPTGDDLAAGRDRSKQADAGQPVSANGTSTKPQ
jgi:NodT family efflux transporter outer membrane factor (OMF) lipoprotein